MPKAIKNHIRFDCRLPESVHMELNYIAQMRGLVREDGHPNKAATIRMLIAEEAERLQNAPTKQGRVRR